MLVPHEQGEVAPALLEMVAAYDPNYVRTLAPTCGQLARVLPGRLRAPAAGAGTTGGSASCAGCFAATSPAFNAARDYLTHFDRRFDVWPSGRCSAAMRWVAGAHGNVRKRVTDGACAESVGVSPKARHGGRALG